MLCHPNSYRKSREISEETMISSAREFIEIRNRGVKSEYDRASQEEAPIEVWREVVEGYPDYRKWVAHNKTVPVEILRELSTDMDSNVRDMVARKRKSPSDVLERLATDPDEGVRYVAAWNKKAPRYVLMMLRDDPWSVVRDKVDSCLRRDSSSEG